MFVKCPSINLVPKAALLARGGQSPQTRPQTRPQKHNAVRQRHSKAPHATRTRSETPPFHLAHTAVRIPRTGDPTDTERGDHGGHTPEIDKQIAHTTGTLRAPHTNATWPTTPSLSSHTPSSARATRAGSCGGFVFVKVREGGGHG